MHFAKQTKYELVMVQLYLENAYDNVNWLFVRKLMAHLGFGKHMSRLIYTWLVKLIMSRLMEDLIDPFHF